MHKGSGFDDLGSGFDDLGSGFDDCGSGFDDLGSGFDNLGRESLHFNIACQVFCVGMENLHFDKLSDRDELATAPDPREVSFFCHCRAAKK